MTHMKNLEHGEVLLFYFFHNDKTSSYKLEHRGPGKCARGHLLFA